MQKQRARYKIEGTIRKRSAEGIGADGMQVRIALEFAPKHRQVSMPVFQSKRRRAPSPPLRFLQNRQGKIARTAGNIQNAEPIQSVAPDLPGYGIQQDPPSSKEPVDAPKVQQTLPHILGGHFSCVQKFPTKISS